VRYDGATAVSGSAWLRCVAQRGGVSCGGQGDDGQLGRGVRGEGLPMGPVRDLGAVEALAVDRELVCALEAGAPRCWGQGALLPVRFEAGVVGTDLDVNDGLACLVTPEGGVSCLGPGAHRFGEPDRWQPVDGLSDAVEVEIGVGFVCARHRDGRVSCWGDARNGRLGDGTATWSVEPVRVPTPR
jgi:hypothetical protein